jgi:hypothetical protein
MSSFIEIEAIQGVSVRQNIILTVDGGGDASGFTADDTLTAVLWTGENQAVITSPTSPTAVWVGDPATARPQVQLYFDASLTAALSAGRYPVMLKVNDDQAGARVATLIVIDGPGAGTTPPIYGSRKGMLDEAPYLEQLQSNEDLRGYTDQLARARRWIDRMLLSRAEHAIYDQSMAHGPYVMVDPIPITAGYDGGPLYGRSVYPDTTGRDQVASVKAALDADQLMRDDGVIDEIATIYAVGLVLMREVSNDTNGVPYRTHGLTSRGRAMTMLAGYTAMLDTDEDGVADRELRP